MGREIRKVTKEWEHPKDENGKYHPMYDEYYGDAISKWFKEHILWTKGKHPNQDSNYEFYAEYAGNPPELEYYRKEKWIDKEVNCFQYYETVSEGTPLSPVFETLKELEDWLVNNKGHSRIAAQNFCKSGYAPSMIYMPGIGMKSGVDSCEFD